VATAPASDVMVNEKGFVTCAMPHHTNSTSGFSATVPVPNAYASEPCAWLPGAQPRWYGCPGSRLRTHEQVSWEAVT
jgi:hypothetical protein